MKWKNRLFTITKMFLLLLTLLLPWTAQEQALAASETGSITISLKDLETPKKDVAFRAYEVGEWNGEEGNWNLIDTLSSTKISLKDLKYASDWDAAARILAQQKELESLPSISGKTDADGKLTFTNLEWGMYLVVQEGVSEYGIVDPFLATLPYVEDGVRKNDLSVEPKSEPPLPDGDGRIEVTKRVNILNLRLLEVEDVVMTKNISYYVGIFKDAQGKIPYGTNHIKEIPMKGKEKGTVTFEKLPVGTYYIFETDKNGKIYELDETQNDLDKVWVCKLEKGSSQEVFIDGKADSPAAQVGFCNLYSNLPDSYYKEGTLYITKQVKDGDKKITASETFYAGIFEDQAGKKLYKIVELKQNGTVTLDHLPLGGDDGTGDITYYVYETDKDGKRIDKDSFGYTISGEGKAELRSGSWEDTVTLVNSKKDEASQNESQTQNGSVRTGDDTPIAVYLIMMAAALLILLLGVGQMRGRKRHER